VNSPARIDGKPRWLPFDIVVDHYCPPCGQITEMALSVMRRDLTVTLGSDEDARTT